MTAGTGVLQLAERVRENLDAMLECFGTGAPAEAPA